MNRKKQQRIDNGSLGVSEFLRRPWCTTEAEDPGHASLHNLHRVQVIPAVVAPGCFTALYNQEKEYLRLTKLKSLKVLLP
jgi:hypothetical protein